MDDQEFRSPPGETFPKKYSYSGDEQWIKHQLPDGTWATAFMPRNTTGNLYVNTKGDPFIRTQIEVFIQPKGWVGKKVPDMIRESFMTQDLKHSPGVIAEKVGGPRMEGNSPDLVAAATGKETKPVESVGMPIAAATSVDALTAGASISPIAIGALVVALVVAVIAHSRRNRVQRVPHQMAAIAGRVA